MNNVSLNVKQKMYKLTQHNQRIMVLKLWLENDWKIFLFKYSIPVLWEDKQNWQTFNQTQQKINREESNQHN